MTNTFHVLSVGPIPFCNSVRDTLLESRNARLFVARDSGELWVIPQREVIHLAILHNAPCGFDLEDACRFIRRQWPVARILLVCGNCELPDDALYDDRLTPSVTPDSLLAAIERIAGRYFEKKDD